MRCAAHAPVHNWCAKLRLDKCTCMRPFDLACIMGQRMWARARLLKSHSVGSKSAMDNPPAKLRRRIPPGAIVYCWPLHAGDRSSGSLKSQHHMTLCLGVGSDVRLALHIALLLHGAEWEGDDRRESYITKTRGLNHCCRSGLRGTLPASTLRSARRCPHANFVKCALVLADHKGCLGVRGGALGGVIKAGCAPGVPDTCHHPSAGAKLAADIHDKRRLRRKPYGALSNACTSALVPGTPRHACVAHGLETCLAATVEHANLRGGRCLC